MSNEDQRGGGGEPTSSLSSYVLFALAASSPFVVVALFVSLFNPGKVSALMFQFMVGHLSFTALYVANRLRPRAAKPAALPAAPEPAGALEGEGGGEALDEASGATADRMSHVPGKRLSKLKAADVIGLTDYDLLANPLRARIRLGMHVRELCVGRLSSLHAERALGDETLPDMARMRAVTALGEGDEGRAVLASALASLRGEVAVAAARALGVELVGQIELSGDAQEDAGDLELAVEGGGLVMKDD